MLISTNVWRLILVNQDYNFLTEFLREEVGQVVQAIRQVGHSSRLVTNRLKIGPFRELKRRHEAIFPLPIEVGNQVFEVRNHFLPRRPAEILLRVNEFSERCGGKINEL